MIRLSQHNTNTLDFLKLYGKNHSIASSFFAFTYFGNFVSYKQSANNQRKAATLLTNKTYAVKFSWNKNTRACLTYLGTILAQESYALKRRLIHIAKSTEDHDPHFGLNIPQAK